MKTKSVFIIIGLSIIAGARAQEIKYFDKNWNFSEKTKAYYKEEIIKQNDTNYVVSKWKINDILIFKGNFFSINPIIENGKLLYYDDKGRISSEEEYIMGKYYGEWKYFDTNGNMIEVLNFKKAYHYLKNYQNSDRHIEASYNCDTMPLFIYPNDLIDNNCTVNEQYYKIISVNPENIKIQPKINVELLSNNKEVFNASINQFNNYIKCRIRYPRRALKNQVGNMLIITFIIDKKGEIIYPILRKGNSDFFYEVCRVLFDSPKWINGFENGMPVNVRLVLQVDFTDNSDNINF